MSSVVDIIICTKDNKDIISKCLDAVRDQSYEGTNCMVLDDNSIDGSCEFIESHYPFVKCIRLDGQGPSRNRNVGIKESSGKYVVTLDSDSILEKNWVSKMVSFMDSHPEAGIASGKILFEDQKDIINSAGGGLSKAGVVTLYGSGEVRSTNNETRKVIFLCSAAMIVRRDIMDTIGDFDGDFFYGHEDVDLCWRANIAGFDVLYYPDAESYHEVNGTVKKMDSARSRFLASRNRTLMLLKNYQITSLLRYTPLFIAHFVFLLIFRNKPAATISGYIWNLRHIRETGEKRRKINATRKRSDKELLSIF